MAFILRSRNGLLDAEDTAVITALAAALHPESSKLHLHLHGGLVDETGGLDTAKRLSTSQDLRLGEGWHQAFIVWRTGARETVKTNWSDLFDNDRLYRLLLRKLLEFCARRIFAGGITGGSGRGSTISEGELLEFQDLHDTSVLARLDERIQIAPIPAVPFGDLQAAGAVAQEFAAELRYDRTFVELNTELATAAASRHGRGPGNVTAGGEPAELARLSRSVFGYHGAGSEAPGRGLEFVLIAAVVRLTARVVVRFRPGGTTACTRRSWRKFAGSSTATWWGLPYGA